ncbi:MAG: 3-hydroxybutyrate dehydrogenase [Alphaproteobacteria bacterium]|nr:3-hydroxybutyrate dehydrogenase [Alphaproteobacteria bacterium]
MAERFLADKVAVVTGSTSGIGLAIAGALAGAGARVMLNGFGEPGVIEAVRQSLEAHHRTELRYSAADMGKPGQAEQIVREAEMAWGRVDILVNNAGVQFVSAVEHFPPERWDQIIAVNLSATFHTIRAALPGMRSREWGRIINIASAHGLVASPNKVAYVAAKHGVMGITKVVALETAGSGITCNAICPGFVETPLAVKQVKDLASQHGVSEEEAARRFILFPQPIGRFVTVEEVAAMALYLCREEARSITGAGLSVDGGWTAR